MPEDQPNHQQEEYSEEDISDDEPPARSARAEELRQLEIKAQATVDNYLMAPKSKVTYKGHTDRCCKFIHDRYAVDIFPNTPATVDHIINYLCHKLNNEGRRWSTIDGIRSALVNFFLAHGVYRGTNFPMDDKKMKDFCKAAKKQDAREVGATKRSLPMSYDDMEFIREKLQGTTVFKTTFFNC